MEKPDLVFHENTSFSFYERSIEIQETFGMNVGVLDLSKNSYLRNTALFKKFKSLKSHNKKMKR